MLAKRIIPCLDVKDGMTVKGVNFVNFRNAGDPVELGRAYSQAGADELVFLDITASYEGRKTFIDMVRRVAENVNIPFTVGGGIGSVERKLFEWAKEAQDRGAGAILFTSMDHDGVKEGFACEALAKLNDILSIPVIASGGCGSMEHFRDAFTLGKADAALAASVFHFNEINISELKDYLHNNNINVRR